MKSGRKKTGAKQEEEAGCARNTRNAENMLVMSKIEHKCIEIMIFNSFMLKNFKVTYRHSANPMLYFSENFPKRDTLIVKSSHLKVNAFSMEPNNVFM